MRWSDRALDGPEVVQEKDGNQAIHANFYEVSFDEPMFSVGRKKIDCSTVRLKASGFGIGLEWSQDRGLHINNMTELASLENWNRAKILSWKKDIYIPLVNKGLVEDAYLSLPVDEGVYGKKSATNIKFSKRLEKLFPKIRRHHTFSGMYPNKYSKDEQIAALKNLQPYVDVLCMLPSLYHRFYRTYFKRFEAEKELCLYINRAEHVEHPYSRLTVRTFPRYLWKYGVHDLSYWSTTNWFPVGEGGTSS